MSFTSSNRPMQGDVAVSGNVYFPAWRRSSRLPDGYPAPADRAFVAAMFAGLALYLLLSVAMLACGMAWYALGRVGQALGLKGGTGVSLRRTPG